MSFIYANQPCGDPEALRQECVSRDIPTPWYKRVNVFKNFNGREPGSGEILLSRGQLDAIDLTIDNELWFFDSTGNPPKKLKKITLLRAVCVVPGYEDAPNAAHLCSLVDRRWHLARIPVDKAYNVVCTDGSSYVANTLNSGVAWTWQQIVQDLATTLGIGTLALPFTPHGTPENLVFFGGWAWAALNDVLDRLACTIEYNAEDDTFTILRQGDTTTAGAKAAAAEQQRLELTEQKTWDGFWLEPDRGRLPEKIRVLFPRRPQPTDGSSIYYAKDITLTATDGVEAGSYEQLVDDMAALGASGTPSNSAALTARAQERADDWRRKRLYAEARATISYQNWQDGPKLLCETIGGVIYDGRGGAARTELMSEPDGLLEKWRPYVRPLLLGDCTTSGSGSATGSNTGTATASNSRSNSLSGSASGSGSTSSNCIVQAVKESRCIQGINRVTRGTLVASIVNGTVCLTYTNLTTTSEGCCVCPDSASGSGSATGSNSSTGGGGGGGSTFVPCCVDPVPNTLYATFGGDLAFLGSRSCAYVGYFAGLGNIWESDCFDSGCYGSGGPGNGGLVRAWVACRDSGTWEAGAVQTSVRGGAYQCELTVNTVTVTMTPLTGTCSPINLSGSGTSSPAATNPACASKTGTVVVTQ